MLACLFQIGFARPAVALDGKSRDGRTETPDALDLVRIERRFTPAQMPADQLDGQSASNHDARGFGIAPNVVFRRWGYIAFAAWRSAHHYASANHSRNLRLFLQNDSNIRQRA